MKKTLKIFGVVAFILLVIFIFTFFIGRSADSWLCKNGEWVKIGEPDYLPEGFCGNKKITGEDEIICQSFLPENCPEKCVVCPPCPECSSLSCQTEEFCAELGIGREWYENIRNQIKSFSECVAAGNAVMESYPRQCRAGNRTFTENIGNELEKIDLIRIDSPRPNQIVESPLLITGQARGNWFFEADFPVILLNNKGETIASAIATAKDSPADEGGAGWMTEDFVPFEAKLEFFDAIGGRGELVLKKDNPSGLPENDDALRVPIIFGGTEEKIKIKVYFNNNRLDPEFSCNKVFPAEREVIKTEAIARAALEELLKGATEEEKEEGFFTSINSGVEVQSLTIKDGMAKVDFDEQLEFQVGGSCRVSAISAQIRETLKQFSTVDEVIISINGRTEDILQP
ncbi:MAG: GerMN domain-containing protein [Patescibacteria group bacterium]|nr:GerMN domain-containing protein [Patescibacteria group bacterium]